MDKRCNDANNVDPNSINLNLLKYFIASAESSSLAEAGEKLGYSAPNVSTSINMLEKQLGVTLFTRKPLKLTEIGKAIYDTVKDGFQYLDFMMIIANSKNGLEFGRINIGCPSHISNFYAMERIVRATKDYPNMQINIDTESSSNKLIELIKNNEIDFAILDVIPNEYANELVVKEIRSIDNIFVANKEIQIKEMKELEKYNFILSYDNRVSTAKLIDVLKKNDITIKSSIRCPTTEQRIKAATLGGGIAYILKESVKTEIENGELFEVKVPIDLPKSSIKIVYLKNHLTKVDKEFINKYLK